MNWKRWDFTLDKNTPPWGMDARHVEMIKATLIHLRVQRVVEIGCLLGRSTSALVEAKEDGGWLKWAGLCDMKPTEELRRVITELVNKDVRVETLWNDSKLIPWVAECWLIDGDHSPDGVWSDFRVALKGGAQVIILHDTYHHLFKGPGQVAEMLRGDAGFVVFEDFKKRPGEETERGLTIAAPAITGAFLADLKAIAAK